MTDTPALAAASRPRDARSAGDAGGTIRTLRSLGGSALFIALCSAVSFAITTRLHHRELPRWTSDNIFYYLVGRLEPPFFVITGITALAISVYLLRTTPRHTIADSASAATAAGTPAAAAGAHTPPAHGALWAALAVAVAVATWLGSRYVMHDFPFAMDEYNAVFQAAILASGRTAALLPAAWRPFGDALAPVFTSYYPKQHVWRSGYLPVYASIRAAFHVVGAEGWTNPVLAALTVPALAGAGRRLWPESPRRTWYAVLFLVTSSQFLITSTTRYSMPAHLLLNMLWLYLYLRDDTFGLAAAPVVGAFALGLHQPFPHALFIAPFLLSALLRRRIGWLAYAGTVYGAAAIVWLSWLRASSAYLGSTGGGLRSTFALPHFFQFYTQGLASTLVLSWMPPLVSVLAVVALLRWRDLRGAERDLAAGLLLTAVFHLLFPLSQGHGWGDRYLYSAIGNLVLIAAVAADWGAASLGRVRFGRLVAASTAVALLVELPLRAYRVEQVVRPFALASAYAASRPESVVIVYPDSSYYGRDLVRNDPFLHARPKILSAPALGDTGMRRIEAEFGPSSIHRLQPAELRQFGVPTFSPPFR